MADQNAATFQYDNWTQNDLMGCRSLVVRLRLTLWRRGRHLLVVIAEERGRELVTHPARIRLPRLCHRSHGPGGLGHLPEKALEGGA